MDLALFAAIVSSPKFLWCLLFWLCILFISWADFKTLRIPLAPMICLAILGAVRLGIVPDGQQKIVIALASGGATFLVLWMIGHGYQRYRGVSGLGSYDPIYAGILCLWIEPFLIPWAMVCACVITLLLAHKRFQRQFGFSKSSQLPFAPGLGLGFGTIMILFEWQHVV